MALRPLKSERRWCALPRQVVEVLGPPPYPLFDTSRRLNRWLCVLSRAAHAQAVKALENGWEREWQRGHDNKLPKLHEVLSIALASNLPALGLVETPAAVWTDDIARVAWLDRPLVVQLANLALGGARSTSGALATLGATNEEVDIVERIGSLEAAHDATRCWAGLLYEGAWEG